MADFHDQQPQNPIEQFPIRKIWRDDLPPRLLEIPNKDIPAMLYVRGDQNLLYEQAVSLNPNTLGELPFRKLVSSRLLCVVGSRECTPYGKEVCEKLIAGLRGFPITIVSGLALGIDSIAHRAALSAGLKTVAVPGSGLDPSAIYPSNHARLANEILAAGGCLISEFPPLERARAYFFPQRNRIMAGLCHATLIIEAEADSGTLITARLTLDYNRDLLAVPGSIFSDFSVSCHNLIRDGATPITSSADLLQALGFEVESDEVRAEANNQYENAAEKTPIDFSIRCPDVTSKELILLEFLRRPKSRDQIFTTIDLPAAEINATLSSLELKGWTEERGGELRLAKN